MTAMMSGPTAPPKLPPTWKMDWARPRLPPEASEVMREASGWIIEEPMPMVNTARYMPARLGASARQMMPSRVKVVASSMLPRNGFLSKSMPTRGWNTDAASW